MPGPSPGRLPSNHSRAVARALTSNHTRAVGRALTSNHSRAVAGRGCDGYRGDGSLARTARSRHAGSDRAGGRSPARPARLAPAAADEALSLRDAALAALDEGEPFAGG